MMDSKKYYVRYSTKTVTVTKSVRYSTNSNDSPIRSPMEQASYREIPRIAFPESSRQTGTSFGMNQSSRSRGCSCITLRPNRSVVRNNLPSSNSTMLDFSQGKPRANSTGSIRSNPPSMDESYFDDTIVANEPTGMWYSLNQGSPTRCSTSNMSWSNYNC